MGLVIVKRYKISTNCKLLRKKNRVTEKGEEMRTFLFTVLISGSVRPSVRRFIRPFVRRWTRPQVMFSSKIKKIDDFDDKFARGL